MNLDRSIKILSDEIVTLEESIVFYKDKEIVYVNLSDEYRAKRIKECQLDIDSLQFAITVLNQKIKELGA